MARFLIYIMGVGALVVSSVWLADRPGSIILQWEGWRVDTSVPVLLLALTIVVGVLTVVARILLMLGRVPRRIAESLSTRRDRRGYLALIDGYVAVAAGDAARATRRAKEAEARLKDPSLTFLLTAQAADLVGDAATARGCYDALLDRPETALVGLRGLIGQARKENKHDEALSLALRAVAQRSDAAWAVQALFDAQIHADLWADADATLKHNSRASAFTPERERSLRAALATERATIALEDGDRSGALKLARQALEIRADMVPAAVLVVRLLTAEGKDRKAATVAEEAWQQAPHPELARACFDIWPEDDALRRVQRAERLAAFNPNHMESKLAVAGAFLDAELWGQARSQLVPFAGGAASRRVAVMMARLEQAERGNVEDAAEWLRRASAAPADPAWRCTSCADEAEKWSLRCPYCGAFDTISWSASARSLVRTAQSSADPLPDAKIQRVTPLSEDE